MQAIRLQKKYPEVSQDEMFDLISRFKCVSAPFTVGIRWCAIMTSRAAPALFTQKSRGA